MTSPLDLGKVGDGAGGGADFVEEFEAVLAQGLVVDVDRHLIEEGVDIWPKLSHGSHGGFKILGHDGALGFGSGLADRMSQGLFFVSLISRRLRCTCVFAAVLLFLNADDVSGPLVASEQVLA